MKERIKKLVAVLCVSTLAMSMLAGCKSSNDNTTGSDTAGTKDAASETVTEATTEGTTTSSAMTNEDIVIAAAQAGKVGNWGLGNEYEIQALLAKCGQDTTYLSQAFDMDEEGVAMLEDNIFCTKAFAEANPNTVKAFLYASMKGWAYACENPEEAAEIVYKYGSSVSADHQAYMADEVKKLVETDMNGNTVTDLGNMDEDAMQQTLDLAKQYITLDDSAAADTLAGITLDDIRDGSYLADATTSTDGKFDVEQSDVSIQLKWLPQAQFMGYYVALDKGYYDEAGLTVDIEQGGGDISETTAVNNGTVDFGVTWVSNLIAANAGGMQLEEVAQVYQRSGLVLVYKLDNFK